jgi:hypothetical protein
MAMLAAVLTNGLFLHRHLRFHEMEHSIIFELFPKKTERKNQKGSVAYERDGKGPRNQNFW